DVAASVVRGAQFTPKKSAGMNARAFNIGTGVPTSVVDLASALMRAAGHAVPVTFAAPRPGEQMHSYLTIDKAAAELGWRPSVSLSQGLAETFAWFAQRASTSSGSRA
ncbi:MAG TPA: UDP-glucose 4-epimerase, partial [Gemmatimonadaceae bacterium]|nr:UDP-glucose 4-epimerase [Gemmatimonadaceae bacterium]